MGWLFALRSSTHPCAASCSVPSRSCCGSSTKEQSCPIAFVEHEHAGGPALYEYRPLVRAFVEERAPRLRGRDDALIALEELQREPAAAIFARAHAGPRPSRGRGALPHRPARPAHLAPRRRAAASTGTTRRSTAPTPSSSARSSASVARYAAVAPLVGHLGRRPSSSSRPGLRVRAVADGELARHWPEAGSLVPQDFGRETDRYCVLELRAALAAARIRPTRPPRSPTPSARSGSRRPRRSRPGRCCSRRSTGARSASGPCCRSPRPQPPGEATRLDSFRGALAGELLLAARPRRRRQRARRGARPLGAVALPERAVPLRAAARGLRRAARRDVAAAGGRPARDRAAGARRRSTPSSPRSPRASRAAARAADAVRRALVEALQHGDRAALAARARRGAARRRASGARSASPSERVGRQRPRRTGLTARPTLADRARLILLTGATGYVGGRLLHALEERGERVRCLSRRPEYLLRGASPRRPRSCTATSSSPRRSRPPSSASTPSTTSSTR